MTLTLDDVRNKRFRMARKSGYEVLEVDEFVDEVEAAFEQLTDENSNLKKQIESLKSAPGAVASGPGQGQPAPAQPAAETIVVTTSKEASSAVVRLVEMSTDQSERLVAEATADANRIREEASRGAHQVTTDARTRAERIESEARVHAERLQSDAMSRAEALDRDIDSRRVEMFGELEKQRDALSNTVDDLRRFESTYRQNLTAQLREQIQVLETTKAEPDDVPEGAEVPAEARSAGDLSGGNRGDSNQGDSKQGNASQGDGVREVEDGADAADGPPTLGGGSSSETPRLDALLGEQR
jgi:DivIVA domain-containing protein